MHGCEVIAIDILIWGQDKEEHNIRRCAILEWKTHLSETFDGQNRNQFVVSCLLYSLNKLERLENN